MAHKLDFIKKEHILKAIDKISKEPIPINNQWSEYWINYNLKLFQYKYVVEVASSFTPTPIKTSDFSSNESSRNYISSLGFHIFYKSPNSQTSINYWVGASYYGARGSQIDMFDDFIKKKYWRTDHDLSSREGLKIYFELKKVKLNDRICIRYFDKKGNKVEIAAIGTVVDVSKINDGSLDVIWDYNPFKYKGDKPSGVGSGNWWKTIFQIKKHSDISRIFGETLIEKRIARLAWNDYGWVLPSGSYGKSDNKGSHEGKYGYGHEEWLFDTSKIVEGFHYGFLEPIRKEQDAFANKTYDVWLYSINSETKKRFWIGEITNLDVITSIEAERIKKIYYGKGWLNEMEEQIKASGANNNGFSNWVGLDLFNVKFRLTDILINDPYYELLNNHPVNELSRYAFGHFKEEYKLVEQGLNDTFSFITKVDINEDDTSPKSKTYIRQPKSVEIEYIHKAISNSLVKTLKEVYGIESVTPEHPAGYGANKIDIVVNNKNHLIFYEIKTFNSIKTSVREALGQLLEYCFYPDLNKAKELIVVTQYPADSATKKYFSHLRTTFNIPIYYQSYDIQNKRLSEKS
jgi:hypothetical protein